MSTPLAAYVGEELTNGDNIDLLVPHNIHERHEIRVYITTLLYTHEVKS